MKKAILSSILLLSASSIFADTTMCFKENHQSMSTIENTPLDGGLCMGKNTISDMKAKGWNVDDIKISQSANGMNFIYVLKTPVTQAVSSSNFSGNQADMEARILEKLEKKKEAEKKEKEIIVKKNLAEEGKDNYIRKCQSCHGEKGESTVGGYSRPLNTLTSEDMRHSINGYTNGTYDRGRAATMQPITSTLTYVTLEKISAYLDSIK
ncbi:cytochrome c [Arcobacter sp. s6]|uniref:cytochrome c n=1 Tax=Arcobacter sp. s6 TaxID=3230363 RepID=UPI0034A0712D